MSKAKRNKPDLNVLYAEVGVHDYPVRHVSLTDKDGLSIVAAPYSDNAQEMFYQLGDKFGYGEQIPMNEVNKYRDKFDI